MLHIFLNLISCSPGAAERLAGTTGEGMAGELDERRVNDRQAVRLSGTCRAPATRHMVTVLDVSHGGCRLKFEDASVPKGSTILLDVASSQLTGEVAWSGSGTSGIRFHRRLAYHAAAQLGLETPPAQELAVEKQTKHERHLGLHHWVRRIFRF